jgi:excisionase family DNA binding protein
VSARAAVSGNNAGALLTAQEVAQLLQVPVSWVYAEARAGRIPHVTLGRYRRFRREAIEDWIAAVERGPVR